MGMKWEGDLFINTALPFGLRSAPKIFNAVADAVEWIVKQQGVDCVQHYLDAFLVIGQPGSKGLSHTARRLRPAETASGTREVGWADTLHYIPGFSTGLSEHGGTPPTGEAVGSSSVSGRVRKDAAALN